jgi:hypothetical protein
LKPSRAIVILSCDKYSDLWEQITTNVKDNLADLQMPIYLVTNTIQFTDSEINILSTGEDKNWSDSLNAALDKVREDSLLIILDDVYIMEKPDSLRILRCFEILEKFNLATLHTRPSPKKRRYNIHHKDWYEYSNKDEYTANVHAFWDKSSLVNILESGENAWDFEVYGSARLNRHFMSGALDVPLFNIAHLIEKGMWVPDIREIIEELNLSISLKSRAISMESGLGRALKNLVFNFALNVLPSKPRRYFLNFFRRFS